MLHDNFRHQGMRRQLVEGIRRKGIQHEQILEAIGTVPRHLFVDEAFLEFAYQDKAFPIASGQTISQPYTVAYQSQLLMPETGLKILEIGTGSGYQTAVLHKLGMKVYSVERHKELFSKTKELMQKLNYPVKLFYGDGFQGLPSFAPFDRILVTCGAREVPLELIKQLRPSGWMVIPLGPENEQVMTTVIKREDGSFETEQFDKFKFVPMLHHKAR